MKKSELRKLMVKEMTIMKARKELQKITRYIDNLQLYILIIENKGVVSDWINKFNLIQLLVF